MHHVSRIVMGLCRSILYVSLLIVVNCTASEAATARTAKDAGERGKAVTTAARYLQGQGFIDPMLTAENVNDSLLAVEVDHKGWAQLDRNQKTDFLDRVNNAALGANGGVSIDIHVSVNGTKVAASTFSGGQQFLRIMQ
ncbi:MAG TPA: hypothetical protein VJ746_03625 [Nitrospira sp.]|nr:hypothetical protein [Nitrospira sp.]